MLTALVGLAVLEHFFMVLPVADSKNEFAKQLDALKEAGNYRVFADLERHKGQFPSATRYDDLSTLGARLPNSIILSDSDNHASMIEGIRHSRANKTIWKHNDGCSQDRSL